MSDPVWLADVLRAEGLSVVEYPGWRDRGHGDFGNIWGVVAHHTGAAGSPGPAGIANHPELGLASQLHLSRDGVFTVCGVGIAWHAGEGSWPGIAEDNANQVTIGIEAENSGTEGWAPTQYSAYFRGVAAILRHLGQDADHVIAHREWYHGRRLTTEEARRLGGKWDPGQLDMGRFRQDVQRLIDTPTGRSAGMWNEEFENFKKVKVTYGTAIYFMDKLINAIADQVTRGWKQLGSNDKGEPLTLVDAFAEHKKNTAAELADIQDTLATILEKLEGRS